MQNFFRQMLRKRLNLAKNNMLVLWILKVHKHVKFWILFPKCFTVFCQYFDFSALTEHAKNQC